MIRIYHASHRRGSTPTLIQCLWFQLDTAPGPAAGAAATAVRLAEVEKRDLNLSGRDMLSIWDSILPAGSAAAFGQSEGKGILPSAHRRLCVSEYSATFQRIRRLSSGIAEPDHIITTSTTAFCHRQRHLYLEWANPSRLFVTNIRRSRNRWRAICGSHSCSRFQQPRDDFNTRGRSPPHVSIYANGIGPDDNIDMSAVNRQYVLCDNTVTTMIISATIEMTQFSFNETDHVQLDCVLVYRDSINELKLKGRQWIITIQCHGNI